jgi:probable O-glycosylation ligase (exosortase A-associated)
MRDVLILAIVVGLLPVALMHTWVGVMLWTWLSIMNPHKLAWGFAYDAPFAAAAAVATLLSLVISRDKKQMAWDPPVKILIVFLLWMCITTLFSPSPEQAWPQLSKVLKIQLMTLIAIAALHERKHIELFVWVNVLSIGFFGLKGGIWTILHGGEGRVWGPPGGFIEGNNELGVALVMTIPLMNFLRIVATGVWVRRGLLVLMCLSAVSALGTQSRGAMLAISAMAVIFWLRSSKKVATGWALSALALALVLFMPASWDDRMSTIRTYDEDGSAMARIEAWKFALRVANDKLFGGGFDVYTPANYAVYNQDSLLPQAAHSIYFSVLAEHGYVGLILFVLLWAFTFRLSGSLRTKSRGSHEASWVFHLASMCQVSLVGFAVGGAFLSLAYFDFAYNIIVMLTVANRWISEHSGVDALCGPSELLGSPYANSMDAKPRGEALARGRL